MGQYWYAVGQYWCDLWHNLRNAHLLLSQWPCSTMLSNVACLFLALFFSMKWKAVNRNVVGAAPFSRKNVWKEQYLLTWSQDSRIICFFGDDEPNAELFGWLNFDRILGTFPEFYELFANFCWIFSGTFFFFASLED